jgi:hypothetical protein
MPICLDFPATRPATGGQSLARCQKKQPPGKADDKTARRAALEYERAEWLRESERRKEESARQKERERRQRAVAKAQEALEKDKREHDGRKSTIEAERSAVEKRSQAEEARWEKLKTKLEIGLRRAHESNRSGSTSGSWLQHAFQRPESADLSSRSSDTTRQALNDGFDFAALVSALLHHGEHPVECRPCFRQVRDLVARFTSYVDQAHEQR